MEKDPQEVPKYTFTELSQHIDDLKKQLSKMTGDFSTQTKKLEKDKNVNETALKGIKENHQIQEQLLKKEIHQLENVNELLRRIERYLCSYVDFSSFDLVLEAKVEVTNLEAPNPVTYMIHPILPVTEISAEQLSKLSNVFSEEEESHLTKKDKIKEDNKIQKGLKYNTPDPKSFNGLIIRKNQYQVITTLEFLINMKQLFMRNTGITLTIEKEPTGEKIEKKLAGKKIGNEKDKGTLSYKDFDKEKGVQNILHQRKPLAKDENIVYMTEFYDELTKQRYGMKIVLAMEQNKIFTTEKEVEEQPISVYELKKMAEKMNEITYGNKKVKDALLKIKEYNKEQIEEIMIQINENAYNIIQITRIDAKLEKMTNDYEEVQEIKEMRERLNKIIENKENIQEIIQKINNDIYDENEIKDMTKQLNEITQDNGKIESIMNQLDSIIKSERKVKNEVIDAKEEMLKELEDIQEQTKKILEKKEDKETIEPLKKMSTGQKQTDKTTKTKKLNYEEIIIKRVKEIIEEMKAKIKDINISQEEKEETQKYMEKMQKDLTTVNNYRYKIQEKERRITETQEIIQQLDKIINKQEMNIKLQDVKVTSCFCEIDTKHRLEREKLPTEIKFQE